MDNIKTICSDVYGMETSEEFKDFVNKYESKMDDLAKEFVEDCVDNCIEFESAHGLFLSMAMTELSLMYAKKALKDIKNNNK